MQNKNIDKTILEIDEYLNQMKNIYNQENGARKKIEEEKNRYEKRVNKNNEKLDIYNIKSLLITETADLARNQGKEMFARMATHGLQIILGPHLSVKILAAQRGSSPTLDFLVKSEYEDYTIEASPTEGEGGGVADIVALSSFLNLNYLNTDLNKAPLILDEPTKYVSKGNAENVANFIKEISKSTNKQIIMSTHDIASEYVADNVFFITQKDGVTEVNQK